MVVVYPLAEVSRFTGSIANPEVEKYIDVCRGRRSWRDDCRQLQMNVATTTMPSDDLYLVAIGGTGDEAGRLLEERGANCNAKFGYKGECRPLVDIAIMNGNIDVVKMLCENGADLNHETLTGEDPLLLALVHHFYDVALLLAGSYECDPLRISYRKATKSYFPEFDPRTAMDFVVSDRECSASSAGSADDLLRVFLENPKCQRAIDDPCLDGRTLLFKTVQAEKWHLAEILLENGADPFVTTPAGSCSALFHMFFALAPQSLKVAELICEGMLRSMAKQHPSREAAEHQFNCLLFQPVLNNITFLKKLLQIRFLQNSQPWLEFVTKYFLRDPCFFNSSDDGVPYLITAIVCGNYPLFLRILMAGADVERTDKYGNVAVFYAAERSLFSQDPRYLRTLLEVGACQGWAQEFAENVRHQSFCHEDALRAIRATEPKQLAQLVRNRLREDPKARSTVLAQARGIHAPKAWLEYLTFADIANHDAGPKAVRFPNIF